MKLSLSTLQFAFLVIASSISSPAHPQTTQSKDWLRNGFESPPFSARPHTWWHWINGNISKRGITADLEAMKEFGLGGAQIFNVDVGIPAGDRPFMSARWKEAIQWAFHEAKRLGLEIDIHNGAGWSSSGGPWVTPANSMQVLTWSEKEVEGPVHFDGTLPEPPKKLDYYEDITAYAIKKPQDDLRIANFREKSAVDRGDNLTPDPSPALANAATPLSDVIQVPVGPDGHISVDLPEGTWTIIRMGHTSTGVTNEPAPAAGRGPEVDKLSRSALEQFWSGMMATALKENGPISKVGLIGALIDSYEVGSQNWTPKFRQDFIDRRGYDPMPYLATVTGRVIGSDADSEKFLWDVRRTVSDLFAENYYGYMAQLCHENGIQFSTEGYGNGTFDNLQINGKPDIPMAEFWVGGMATETTKMVSSSAHTYGKQIVGAESFTADDRHAKWLYDPYSIKALGDQMYSYGINRFIFHRFAHQPWLYLKPGMTMGPWGTNFDRTLTWWKPGKAWMNYLTRCQYMLQQGKFKADILVFEGEQGPNDLPLMKGTKVPVGYDYDGVDDEVLLKAQVKNGRIMLPSGMSYKMLVLPDSKWMTNKTLTKISELVHDGATIMGPKPTDSPTLGDNGDGEAHMRATADALWNGNTGAGKVLQSSTIASAVKEMHLTPDFESNMPANWIHRQIGNTEEYFIANPQYKPVDMRLSLRIDGLEPEIWNPENGMMEPAPAWQNQDGRTIMPLHLESAGSIFIVFRHKSPKTHLTNVTWEGSEEKISKAPIIEIISARYEAVDGAGGVDVTQKARELVTSGQTDIDATNANFGDPEYDHLKRLRVVFTVNGQRHDESVGENETVHLLPPVPDSALPEWTSDDHKLEAWKAGRLVLKSSNGEVTTRRVTPSSVPLNLNWHLSFPANSGAPRSATFSKLISWPDSHVPGIKYFSGTAKYTTRFKVHDVNKRGAEYWLDLGTVKNFAEVSLNGHPLPTLWKAPFRVNVTEWLHDGTNNLEVKVTNLWPNRLIGDEHFKPDAVYNGPIQSWPSWLKVDSKTPPGKRVTFTTWQFFTKDSPLLESGLIGPVQLLRVPLISIPS